MCEGVKHMNDLILTSKGLNTRLGRHLYKAALSQMGYSDLSRMTIGLISHPCYEIEEILMAACVEIGFSEKHVFILTGKEKVYRKYDLVYVGEGNTFLTAEYMHSNGLFDFVKKLVQDGAIYLGASCGACLSGSSLELIQDFDTPVLSAKNIFQGLDLLKNTAVIPHYTCTQIRRYMEETELLRLVSYEEIINIANDEVLIIYRDGGRKRIRME